MEQSLIFLGFAIVFIGVILVIAGVLSAAKPGETKTDVQGGGVIMIGPIPIIFGTDKKLLIPILALTFIVMVMAYLLTRRT